MQKECEICGAIFNTTRTNRKYCDDCGKNPKQSQSSLNRAVMRSKYRLGEFDKVREKTCSYCNKTFKTMTNKDFCGNECEKNYKIRNNLCQWCKKPLYPEIITTAGALHPKCKENAHKEWARRHNWRKKCRYCGEEFLANTKNQVYCNSECNKKHKAEDRTRLVPYRCRVCNKKFMSYKNQDWELWPQKAICSRTCTDAENSRKAEIEKMWRESKRKELEAKEKAKKQKKIEEQGLCAFCHTLYKDCELMKSGFKIAPEGAKYKNFKIVECPKFTKEKKKKS